MVSRLVHGSGLCPTRTNLTRSSGQNFNLPPIGVVDWIWKIRPSTDDSCFGWSWRSKNRRNFGDIFTVFGEISPDSVGSCHIQ